MCGLRRRPSVRHLEAAICQLTLGRHSNQNAPQPFQSVPPQVGSSGRAVIPPHTLRLSIPSLQSIIGELAPYYRLSTTYTSSFFSLVVPHLYSLVKLLICKFLLSCSPSTLQKILFSKFNETLQGKTPTSNK